MAAGVSGTDRNPENAARASLWARIMRGAVAALCDASPGFSLLERDSREGVVGIIIFGAARGTTASLSLCNGATSAPSSRDVVIVREVISSTELRRSGLLPESHAAELGSEPTPVLRRLSLVPTPPNRSAAILATIATWHSSSAGFCTGRSIPSSRGTSGIFEISTPVDCTMEMPRDSSVFNATAVAAEVVPAQASSTTKRPTEGNSAHASRADCRTKNITIIYFCTCQLSPNQSPLAPAHFQHRSVECEAYKVDLLELELTSDVLQTAYVLRAIRK